MSNEKALTQAQQLGNLLENCRQKFSALTDGQEQIFEREKLHAMAAVQKNDYLMTCAGNDKMSLASSLLQVATLDITLNPAMRLCYLVPRDNRVILDLSYMGMVEIARRSGIKEIICQLVRSGDEFEFSASDNKLVHKYDPFLSKELRGQIIGGYCCAMIDGFRSITVMSFEEIEDIKKRNPAVRKGAHTPWISDYEEMAKKTIIKKAFKLWPKSEKMAAAVEIDNEANGIDFEEETKRIREEHQEKAKQEKQAYLEAHEKLSELRAHAISAIEEKSKELPLVDKISLLKSLGLKTTAEVASMRDELTLQDIIKKLEG
jgi:phage RecT family recombinase